MLGLVGIMGREHLPVDEQPIELGRAAARTWHGERVLNDYNVAGIALYFGGPRVQVAIDGRADRYGKDYINDYMDMMILRGDWESLLRDLDPTSALLEARGPARPTS